MPFQKTPTEDKDLAKVQDQLSVTLNELEKMPFTGSGVLLKDVTLKSGQDNLISHTLNRTLQIWLVVRVDANTVVWEQATSSLAGQSSSTKLINLRCSTSCTVSLWVA